MASHKVGIIGIGLIGGSIALGLRKSGWASEIVGIDTNPDHQQKALELGLVDRVATWQEAIDQVDVFVCAIPVDLLVALIPSVLDALKPGQVIIEVGSTKTPVFEALQNHPKRAQFVSTHPMAGTEFSGPEAAVQGLFVGKRGVICDKDLSDPSAVALIEDLLEKEKNEARIFELASTGFESTVRLAKSSPETWSQIFHQNQENLLDVLDEYINTLLKYKGLMLSGSYEKLKQELGKANDIGRILKG
jgi:prephenate dehydrogenase